MADQDPGDDPDNDGISNLVEYAIEGPTVSHPNIGSFAANTLSFAKRLPFATDLNYAIEVSTELGATPCVEAPGGPSYVNDSTTTSYIFPGTNPRDFMRLRVTGNP